MLEGTVATYELVQLDRPPHADTDPNPHPHGHRYEVVQLNKNGSTKKTICDFINSDAMQPVTFAAMGMQGRKCAFREG